MDERTKRGAKEALKRKEDEARAKAEEKQLIARERPQHDVPRTKSSGHRKKTADKWNQ
jgi:hypothetical protein